jgi:hypothetical protein
METDVLGDRVPVAETTLPMAEFAINFAKAMVIEKSREYPALEFCIYKTQSRTKRHRAGRSVTLRDESSV